MVSEEERTKLSNLLNSKYALTNGGGFAYVTVDTSQPSTHNIKYSVHDNSGNHAKVVRTVIVSGDETKPFILLNGEVTQTIEAGSISDYTDPGAVAKSADGTTLKDDLSGQGDAVDVRNPVFTPLPTTSPMPVTMQPIPRCALSRWWIPLDLRLP